MSRFRIHHGDCLAELSLMPDNSFDALYSDVPYGLGPKQPTGAELIAYLQGEQLDTHGDFMGKRWTVPSVNFWRECFRVLKPGAPLLVNAAPRTEDLVALGMRAAGFETGDVIMWMFAEAMPKSHNLKKATLAAVGAVRDRIVGEWIIYSTIADDAGIRFLKAPSSHGPSTQSENTAIEFAVDLRNQENDDARAIIAELRSFEAPHIRAAIESSATTSAGNFSHELNVHASGAVSFVANDDPKHTRTSIARSAVWDSESERAAHKATAVEALRIWLGGARSFEPTDLSALLAALGIALRRIIASQSATFLSLGTTRQMECVSAMTATITASTAADLISFTADILASEFDGIGTALAPGYEPVILAWKPNEGTYVENVMKHGTGGLAIDASRIESAADYEKKCASAAGDFGPRNAVTYGEMSGTRTNPFSPLGRWPKNIILDEAAGALLDETVGDRPSGIAVMRNGGGGRIFNSGGNAPRIDVGYNETGGPSRFYFCAKASRAERDLGCEHLPLHYPAETVGRKDDSVGINNGRAGAGRTGEGVHNPHPNVKTIELTRYLSRLVLPPERSSERRLLVPYCGSGSEMVGALIAGWDHVVGIERDAVYIPICEARCTLAATNPRAFDPETRATKKKADDRQHDLFGKREDGEK